MKRALKISIFAAMLMCSIAVWGQEQVLFQNINTALSQGDCDRAQRNYNVWKDFTNSADSSIERRIAECKDAKAQKPLPQETKIDTLVAVAPSVEVKIEPASPKDSIPVQAGDNADEWNKLAKIYVDTGGEENYAKAFALLKKSAQSNNASGLCSLGYMYEKGLGTPNGEKDEVVAARLYTASAKQNYAPAQYNLGLMYEYGTGVKQDKNEAMRWYEAAAKQGFIPAEKKLNK